MKKNLLAIIFGLAIIFTVYNFKEDPDFLRAEVGNGYRVAACPTHHHMLPALDRGGFPNDKDFFYRRVLENDEGRRG